MEQPAQAMVIGRVSIMTELLPNASPELWSTTKRT